MKQILVVIGVCLSLSAFGQGGAEKNGTKKQGAVDSATIRCYYLFSKTKEGAEKPFRADTMVLDIGANVSRFYDPGRLGRDSILGKKMTSMDPSTIKSINIFKADSGKDLSELPGTISSGSLDGESYQIFKDKKTKKITVLDYVDATRDRFKFEDEPGTLPWKILSETDTVASYTCQKATLNFRGRDYTAWFTTDIPVSEGPWKFAGLPGLILKIEDTKGLFAFKLIGLEQLTTPIAIQINDAKSIKCTRAEFEKQKLKQGSGLQININAGVVLIAEMPGKFDYTPMELE